MSWLHETSTVSEQSSGPSLQASVQKDYIKKGQYSLVISVEIARSTNNILSYQPTSMNGYTRFLVQLNGF